MHIVIPYPNGKKYGTPVTALAEREEQRNEILDYVKLVCVGPWESDHGDILWRGVRIRLGCKKDYFMLQLKYSGGI